MDLSEAALHDGPLPCQWISEEADGLSIGAIEPSIVEPGVPIVKLGYECHGSKVKFPAVLGPKNAGEVLLVSRVELLLREAGIEGAHDMVDLRSHGHAFLQRNRSGGLGMKSDSQG